MSMGWETLVRHGQDLGIAPGKGRHMRELWVVAHGALWGFVGTFDRCRKCGEQGSRKDPTEQLSQAGIYSAA